MKLPSLKKHRKKRWRNFFYFLYVGLATLLLFELTYRFQWVDFYADELRSLNPPSALSNPEKKPTLLIMGDSFTAFPGGYADQLREIRPEYSVVNAAVPGTGIIQTALMAPNRITQFQPELFVYQVYVGNDLMDISHPISGNISFLRKAYWFITDRVRSLSFLNFRFAGLRYRVYDDANTIPAPKEEDIFTPDVYAGRQKLYFQAEPNLVENSAFLEGGRLGDMEVLIEKLDQIIAQLPADCKVIIPVIPHCAQVNDKYAQRMQQIGMQAQDLAMLQQEKYPFIQALQDRYTQIDGRVLVINLLPYLRAEDAEHPVYYENDPHLTPAGQAIVARYLTTPFPFNPE